jgi:predicted metal-dependent peptidase
MNTFRLINESVKYGQEGNAEEIYNLGEINIIDVKKNEIIKINSIDIIKVVNDAMFYMQKKYPYLHTFLNAYKVMYIPTFPSNICDTMCVDESNNLWINLNFVYVNCEMKQNNVFGILFHEMFHIFLEHLVRFNKMFPQ